MIDIEEYFSRSIMLYGLPGFQRVQGSTVVVLGLGGVGSYAVEALARGGVGTLRLVDCDIIKPTDINRQLLALATNTGQKKVEAAASRLRSINPAIRLEIHDAFFHEDTAEELLGGNPDFIVDAIDSLNPKAELIAQCIRRQLPVVSALGAAGKTDPAMVRFGTLRKTEICPLARALRKYLNNRHVPADIPVVYSLERPVSPHPDGPRSIPETGGTYVRGRQRQSLPSLPTIPAIFGLIAANYVVLELAKEKRQLADPFADFG
ncbi:MAG: tRNA threonylcarbamoyladenosine dehydratase [Syntrophorhabdus sp.]